MSAATETAPRAVVDFFTNPTYVEVVALMEQQLHKETETLKAVGRGESATKFSHQTGVCDGIERSLLLLKNQRTKWMGAEKKVDGDAPPQDDES